MYPELFDNEYRLLFSKAQFKESKFTVNIVINIG